MTLSKQYFVARASQMHGGHVSGEFVSSKDMPAPCDGVERGENTSDGDPTWYIYLTPTELIEFLRTHGSVIVQFDESEAAPWPAPLLIIYDGYVE